jgi:hypothetical protein
MNRKFSSFFSVLSFALISLNVQAKVPPAVADTLGKSLTPFGSIKESNNYKTIPPWTGGIVEAPEGYQGNGSPHIDPFAADEIKFSIDKSNYQTYKKKLTPGQYKLFQTYPDTFKINVYPTHRSHSMPDWVLKNTRKNAVTASLSENGLGFKNAYGGIPFPILHGNNEEQALQTMWNHLTRWRGIFLTKNATEISVQQNGAYTPITKQYEILFNYYKP